MPAPTGPVTLRDLIREDKLLCVYCRDCHHERDINPANVPLSADTAVPAIGNRMKCSNCGSRSVTTAPELCPGGIVAMRERLRNKADNVSRCRKRSGGFGPGTLLSLRAIALDLLI